MSKKKNSAGVGDGISAETASWTFNGSVTTTFSGHVRRSVPLYDAGHDLICKISNFFVTPDSDCECYELGTSNGDLLEKMAGHNRNKLKAKWVGIDLVPEMIATANEKVRSLGNARAVVGDVVTFEYMPTDFIVAYYTVQFIHPRVRQLLFNRIYQSLNWGGGFVLFEKVRAPDARFQDMMTSLYNDFKAEQGFSPEEIICKSRSLRGVLEPFSTRGNMDLMERAGFSDVMTIMKYVCFEGFLAIK